MHGVPLYSEALPLLAPTCYRLCGASNPAGGPGSGHTPLVSYSSSLSDGRAQNVDACQCISASLRMHTWGAACTNTSSPHGPDSDTLDSTNSHQPPPARCLTACMCSLGPCSLLQCVVGAVGDHSHPWPVQQLEPPRLPGHAVRWSSSRHCMDARHCECSGRNILSAS